MAKKSGSGGKLTRSQVVTIRLDPKLRYFAELAARKQRRTVSSFIEWAIEQSLDQVHIEGSGVAVPISQADHLWDVDEADRFAKLAFSFPELLTHDEQVMWKIVTENPFFWACSTVEGVPNWDIHMTDLQLDRLRATWADLNKVISGELDRSTLTTQLNRAGWIPKPKPEKDSGLPF